MFIFLGQILLLPLYTNYLSPDDWGIIALFMLFGLTLCGISSLGLSRASYYFYFQCKDIQKFNLLQSTNFYFILIIFTIFGTIVWFSDHIISVYLFNGQLPLNLIKVSYVSGIMQFLSMYIENIITGQNRSTDYSIIVLLRFILSSILSILLLIYSPMTYMARVYGLLISNAIAFIISLYFFRSHFVIGFSSKLLKRSLRFSYPELPLSLIGLIISSADKLLLTNLRGLESLGYFVFGSKFIDILREIPNAVRRSWNPYYFKMANKADKKSKKTIVNVFEKLILFVSIPGVIVVLFSEEILMVFGTENYYSAMYIIPLYVFTYYISLTDFLSSNQITSSEKLMYQLPSAFIGGVSYICLNYFLILKYGAMGAAIAASCFFAISHLVNMFFGQKLFPLPINYFKALIFFLILAFMSLISFLLMWSEIYVGYSIAIKLALCFVIAYIALYFSGLNLKKIKMILLNNYR